MIVPEYWAEAKEQIRIDGRRRTLRRFGWSDRSERDAAGKARERVRDAAERARAGEAVRRIDPKVPYNGAEGVPIREEIVERHGDAVITRNSYGALCLNTPDVLFTDIDVPERGNAGFAGIMFGLLLLAGVWFGMQLSAWWPLLAAFVVAAFISGPVARALRKGTDKFRKDPFAAAFARIEAYARANPSWLLRVYRTPMGYRVLAMHSTFDPREDAPFSFMAALGSDPLYVLMCRNQKCFRARISPKPWRIDMPHIRPRPGVWPVKREHMDRRRRWVEEYERKSAGYASCEFVATLGGGRESRDCERVRAVHDRYCKAESKLPLA
ncbi:MAG: hypothetical protein AAGE85_12570 [Pseudomonadota bacterium]